MPAAGAVPGAIDSCSRKHNNGATRAGAGLVWHADGGSWGGGGGRGGTGEVRTATDRADTSGQCAKCMDVKMIRVGLGI